VAGVLPASGLLQSAFAQEGAVRYCSTSGVRLRSGPGLSYRIVSTLSAGTRVTVIGQARPANGFEWTRVTMSVQSDILEGYVASQFLSRTVAAEPDPRFPIGSAFFVDAGRGRANLRDVPGTESRVVRTVVSGTRGKILDDPIKASGLRWFNVEIEGKFGYLVDDVMIPASPGIEGPGFEAWPVGSNVVVSDGPLNLRDKPYGKSLGTYATGSRATTTARAALLANGNHVIWYPVRTGRGQQGWFAADFLELV
jgi:uncharacterized protein YgiM (DUF1202 family)